jgi:V8-like Glu-specific endopeptidase
MRVTPQWETAPNSQFDFALLTLRDALGAVNQATLGNRPLGFWSHPQLGGGTHIRPLELRVLRQQPVNLSGYPSDKCLNQPPSRPASAAEMRACTGTVPGSPELTDLGSTQWRSFGNIVDPAPATEPRSITYDLDSATGHSGGPVWLRWQDFRNLVAVNTGGFPRPTAPFDIIANMGVRITEDVLKQLREWMKADGVSATF